MTTAAAALVRPGRAHSVTPAPPPSSRSARKNAPVGAFPRTCTATQAPRAKYVSGKFTGIVVNVNMDDIWPADGTANIDLTLSPEWKYYIRKDGTGLGDTVGGGPPPCVIRIHPGSQAPLWMANKYGPFPPGDSRNALQLYNSVGKFETCPRYWTAGHMADQEAFMAYMASSVKWATSALGWGGNQFGLNGNCPFVREIAYNPACTSFVEPCQRATAGGSTNAQWNRQQFVDAGLTGVPGRVLANGPDPIDAAAILHMTKALWTSWFNDGTVLSWRWNPKQDWLSSGGVQTGPATDPANWTEDTGMQQSANDMEALSSHGNNSGRVPYRVVGQPYPFTLQSLCDLQALGVKQRQVEQTGTLQNLADAINNFSTPGYTNPPDAAHRTNHWALMYTVMFHAGHIIPAGLTPSRGRSMTPGGSTGRSLLPTSAPTSSFPTTPCPARPSVTRCPMARRA
jgi:hypothetical protein